MFGTRNQNSPGMPLEYAFSADVKIAGAHIHVAAILMALGIRPSFLSATWKLSVVLDLFDSKTVTSTIKTV